MWKVQRLEYLHRSPFASIAKKHVLYGKEEREYFYVDVVDFCNMIAVTTAGDVVMVRQFRIGTEQFTLEIPGGMVDARDPNPQASALRELREESGYGLVKGGRVLSLGSSHPNPAMQGNRCHYFACGPVEVQGAIENDPNESTEVVLVPIRDIRGKMRAGEMTHALILNAFLFMELHQPEGSDQRFEALLEGLRRV